MIYYLKPPVISFGIIFPVFFCLAFGAGRDVPARVMVPGMVAMALLFTASAMGPLVTPSERQARTWERLVTSPAALGAIIAGDIAAGMAFGALLSLVPLTLGVGLVMHQALLLGGAGLLLASVEACMMKGIERVTPMLGFSLRDMMIHLTGEPQDAPPRMTPIGYEILADTDKADRRLELLHQNVRKNGTISNTIALAVSPGGTLVLVTAAGAATLE